MTELGKFVNSTNWGDDSDEELVVGEERLFADRGFIQSPQKAIFRIAAVQWDAEPSKFDPNWKNVRVYWERGVNGAIFTEYLFVPLTKNLAFGERKSPREWAKIRGFMSMFGLLDRLADNQTALKTFRQVFLPNETGFCEQFEGRQAELELSYGDKGIHVEEIPGLGFTACDPEGKPYVFKALTVFDPATNGDVTLKDTTLSAVDFATLKNKLGQAKIRVNRLRIQSARPVTAAELSRSKVEKLPVHLDPHEGTVNEDIPDMPL